MPTLLVQRSYVSGNPHREEHRGAGENLRKTIVVFGTFHTMDPLEPKPLCFLAQSSENIAAVFRSIGDNTGVGVDLTAMGRSIKESGVGRSFSFALSERRQSRLKGDVYGSGRDGANVFHTSATTSDLACPR